MKKLLQRLDASALEKIGQALSQNGRIGVACSGGSDSVFLLLAALKVLPKERLCALHFNHDVRENAAIDEAFVKDLCGKIGVECICQKRKIALKKVSEESLREARLKFFGEAAKANGISLILQGHIKNDVAETMLMRLARGSSLDGLCAPRPVSERGGLAFARPLLGLSKAEIQACLKRLKQPWCEDESNAQEVFMRNRMRGRIIPEMEKSQNRDFLESAARTRALFEEDSNLISETLKRHCERISPARFRLDAFAAASPALIRRCIQALLSENSLKLRAKAVDALTAEASAGRNAQAPLKNARMAYDARTRELALLKNVKPEAFCVDLKPGRNALPDGSAIILEEAIADERLFELFKNGQVDESKNAYVAIAGERLCARAIAPKDAYAPIGSKKARLVKDMMSARKTDILKRKRLPLVCLKGSHPVWAPTLAPAEAFKVQKGRRAIRLTYIEQD